jgi:Lar family restriction alleviation protein
MSPKLKPCPFCGATAWVATRQVTEFGETIEYVVECQEAPAYCPAANMIGYTPNKEDAIAAWNRRAPSTIEAAAGSFIAAKDDLIAFERANPNDSTKRWEEKLCAAGDAEDALRQAVVEQQS